MSATGRVAEGIGQCGSGKVPYAAAISIWSLYLIGTGRWGSYLGVGQLYVTDVLFAACIVSWLCSRSRGKFRFSTPTSIALLLAGWSLFRAIPNFAEGLLAARDAAPYVYALVVLIVASPRYVEVTWPSRVANLCGGVLAAHSFWVCLSLAVGSSLGRLPAFGGGVPIFSIRADFDALVCGIAALLFIRRLSAGNRRQLYNLAVVVASLSAVAVIGNRGAVLATAVAGVAVGWATIANRRSKLAGGGANTHSRNPAKISVRVLGLLVISAVSIVLAGPYIATLEAPQRIVDTVALIGAGQGGTSAAGTLQARESAWSQVLTYVNSDPSSIIVGVGPGVDFLADSGAAKVIEGTAYNDVRSPHNYFLGTYARLGLIGLLLAISLILCGYRSAWNCARALHPEDEVSLIAVMIAFGFPVLAAVGVVLESPFGAVPFFWALGHLQLHARRRKQDLYASL